MDESGVDATEAGGKAWTAATADEIRAMPVWKFFAEAEAIANSAPVAGVYAAPEWDEMNDDGKCWLAAAVRETLARAAAPALYDALEEARAYIARKAEDSFDDREDRLLAKIDLVSALARGEPSDGR